MSDAIFIVGYYRSGTSALSGALSRLGVKFYNDAAPNEHNPLGFYEIPELIAFDVDLFSRLAVEWTDVRGLPDGFSARADIAGFATRLEEILRRRFAGPEPVWGLKHPHLCRTLPLYERVTRQAGHRPHVVHMFRDPWAAAASQQYKNGLSRAHALLLWMKYATDAEFHARHLPRSWVTYHDFLAGPAAQLRRIAQELGVELSQAGGAGREAAAFVTRQLNRSKPVPQEDSYPPLRALVGSAWEAILDRDFRPEVWDGFARETAGLVAFLGEIGGSRARVIPALGGSFGQAAAAMPAVTALRPAERLDAGGERRLGVLRDAAPRLPAVAVVIVAPPGRAHAVNDTLESLRGQWLQPVSVKIVAVEAVAIDGCETVTAGDAPGEVTRVLCAVVNAAAADYVAVLNAGDTVMADGCLRFALAAAAGPDLLYCDEVVPRDGGAWVRYKPGWDVTRLRQSAYLGDWVWYGCAALRQLGGFDPVMAGAEEYDFQLRLAEAGARVLRVPEALFSRSPLSRRDHIPAEAFCAQAVAAVTAHMARSGIPAAVQNRQYPGLFHHLRNVADPGTSCVMLCDGADISGLDYWMQELLSGDGLSGPVILAGSVLSGPMQKYLTAVTQQSAALEGKVFAVAPALGLAPGAALAAALAMVTSEYVIVLDARARSGGVHGLDLLRARLADPGVALVGARTLVALANGSQQFIVQGPIVIGADTRLGAGHLADDPGPGGWLMVDQEVSAVAPPGVLARTAALAGCEMPALAGDALWIDLCAQLRERGHRLVWTPDVSFVAPAEVVAVDAAARFRQGTAAAQALGWADQYHHPALSLHGNLLAAEHRLGLVRPYPEDSSSLLVSGAVEQAGCVLNAARALRMSGALEASWAPEPLGAADAGRRGGVWLRVNPETCAEPGSPGYSAVFSAAPGPGQKAVIVAAQEVFATSPGLVREVRKLAPPGRPVRLWRPALSREVWNGLAVGTGLNTRPRVLWIDEGIAPSWLAGLIEETLGMAAWIVVTRPGVSYAGAVAQLSPPADEPGWARALGEMAPNILLRPADRVVHADHYAALLAAAAGCHLLVDERLDLPASLGAVRLDQRRDSWQRALRHAVTDLTGTLLRGGQARAAALALPAVEDGLPDWAAATLPAVVRSAAE